MVVLFLSFIIFYICFQKNTYNILKTFNKYGVKRRIKCKQLLIKQVSTEKKKNGVYKPTAQLLRGPGELASTLKYFCPLSICKATSIQIRKSAVVS